MSDDLFEDNERAVISTSTVGLSQKEASTLTDWVNQRAQHEDDPCPHCGSKQTIVQPQIIQLTAPDPSSGNVLVTAPYGTVVCLNCGHLRFFNLLVARVFNAPPAQPPIIDEDVNNG